MKYLSHVVLGACLLVVSATGFATDANKTVDNASAEAAKKAEQLDLGRKTYYEQCFRCHEYGQRGAPMLGYEPDWEDRLKLGREALIDSVIAGKGFMLPKANRDLKSREIVGLMVDYMTSTVTDEAIKNSPEMKAQVKRSKQLANGMKLYFQNCFSCHNTGRNNAPRLGDGLAWQGRKEKGVDVLSKHVIEGHGRMIVKGGSGVESTEEVKSMVEYMLSTLEPSLY